MAKIRNYFEYCTIFAEKIEKFNNERDYRLPEFDCGQQQPALVSAA